MARDNNIVSAARSRFPLYVAIASISVLSLLEISGAFFSFDNKWADQMFRWRGMQKGDPRVVVVAIDDESISKVGQYPWPRGVYQQLLNKLFSEFGAKVAGIDVLFLDPSNPEQDRALVQAASKWGSRVAFSVDVDANIKDKHVFRYPFPALRKVAKNLGVVQQFLIDGDGLVRRSHLIVGTRLEDPELWPGDPEHSPSLALETLALYEKRSPDDYLKGRSNIVVLNVRGQEQRRVGSLQDKDGRQVPIITDVVGIKRLSAWKVLRGNLTPAERDDLKGAIILIGSTAVGAFDHYPSPFSELTPGVEVHANIIDNLLNQRELRPVSGWVTLLLILAFAVASTLIINLAPLWATVCVLSALFVWGMLNYVLFRRLVLLDFTSPGLALIAPFAVLFVRKTLTEAQEKRFIKQTFGQFVAPEVVDEIVKDPSKIKLGGEKREMTVFFLDIAHFTTISEKMDPEALIVFLNKYLSALSSVIQRHKGVVDKYIGDCIMAFWNAPLEQKDHRRLACMSAVECQEVMAELNRDMDSKLPERPAVRIGVNSGPMTVGLTGSEQKLQYTVIGDEVNLASRLEGANKFFGSKIMVSEACYADAKDAVEARELGRVRVVGKAIPIRVYELLATKGRLSDNWRAAMPSYVRGLELFNRRDFSAAKAAFAEVLKAVPDDPPAKLYFNASQDYEQIPPPKDWDGVFNLTAK